MDHAAQLLHAFHLASIEVEDDVVLFEPGFACGSVLIDQRDFHAMFFLEFQLAQAIRVMSRVSTPRYAPPPKSSLENPKDSLKGSCEQS